MNSLKNIKLYFLIIVSSLIMLNCNNMDVLFDITEPVTDTFVITNSVNHTSAADIIMVIDTSGSMGNEAANVRDYLDSNLVGPLESEGIDYHLILIAQEVGIPMTQCNVDMTIPQSLKDNPRFFHVDECIYNYEIYQDSLTHIPTLIGNGTIRNQSTIYFIMITDDRDNITYNNFKTQMNAPPINRDFFTIHGLVGVDPADVGVTIYNVGTQYIDGASDTGGMIFDITTDDSEWSGLFTTMAEQIADQMRHTFYLAEDAIKRGIAVYIDGTPIGDLGGSWSFSNSGNYIVLSNIALLKDQVVTIEYLTVVPPE